MTLRDETPVMDISPWPNGYGFTGGASWWEYLASKGERERLDFLMGVALIDSHICDRLVKERDDALLEAFGLSEATRGWIRLLQANSLDELAEAIMLGR